MAAMISSEVAPSISTQGLFWGLKTPGRPLRHSAAWMHLSGSQKTVISPFVYSFTIQHHHSFSQYDMVGDIPKAYAPTTKTTDQ